MTKQKKDLYLPEPKFYAKIEDNVFLVYDNCYGYYDTNQIPRFTDELEEKGLILKIINDLPDTIFAEQKDNEQIDHAKSFYDIAMTYTGKTLLYVDSPAGNWYKKDLCSYNDQQISAIIGQLKDSGIHEHGLDIPYYHCFF